MLAAAPSLPPTQRHTSGYMGAENTQAGPVQEPAAIGRNLNRKQIASVLLHVPNIANIGFYTRFQMFYQNHILCKRWKYEN